MIATPRSRQEQARLLALLRIGQTRNLQLSVYSRCCRHQIGFCKGRFKDGSKTIWTLPCPLSTKGSSGGRPRLLRFGLEIMFCDCCLR